MTFKVTDARAAELASLDKAATAGPWSATDDSKAIYGVPADSRTGLVCDVLNWNDRALITESRNALPDLLADRRTLLDALRRAETQIDSILCLLVEGPDAAPRGWKDSAQKVAMKALADLRALLASSEGECDA